MVVLSNNDGFCNRAFGVKPFFVRRSLLGEETGLSTNLQQTTLNLNKSSMTMRIYMVQSHAAATCVRVDLLFNPLLPASVS